jgi:hypothetical protein
MRESSEVIFAKMDLLHKRSFRKNKSAWSENSVNFADAPDWINHVFQHRLGNDQIEGPISKRQRVGIDRVIHTGPDYYVGIHNRNFWMFEIPNAIPTVAATNAQNNGL